MIPTRLHAALDAASAMALIAAPRLLGWPDRLARPIAATGAAVAGYGLATRYDEDGSGLLSFRDHLVLDVVQGVGCCAAAIALRDAPPAARAFLGGYGLFSLAVVALTDGDGRGGGRVGRQIPLTRDAIPAPIRG